MDSRAEELSEYLNIPFIKNYYDLLTKYSNLNDNYIRKLQENEINLIQEFIFNQFSDLKEFCENYPEISPTISSSTSNNFKISEKVVIYSMNLEPNIYIGCEFRGGAVVHSIGTS